MNKIKLILSVGVIAASCTSTKEKEIANGELATIDTTYLSKTVQPTEDFFQFSNENWLKNNPVPASESRWGSFNVLDQDNKKKLTTILEDAMEKDGKTGSQEQIIGDYYTSFLDMETRNKLAISPIQSNLDAVDALQSKDELVALIASMHKGGVGAGFRFGVGQDLKDVDNHISYLSQGGIGLPNKTYYTDESKEDIRKEYVTHINKMFALAQLESTSESVGEALLAFETKLAEAMLEPAQMRIPELTYNKKAKSEVVELFGDFDFATYLEGIESLEFDTLIVGQPAFVEKFASTLSSESLDLWKDYLKWNVLNHYAGHLDDKLVKHNFAFYGTTLSGKKEMKPINERAIDEITHKSFGELLGKAFVEKHFSEDAKERVNSMVDNLLTVYEGRIKQLDWMSDSTKEQALTKLHAIGRKLGFPDKWEDYSSLAFNPENYIHNIKETAKFDHKKNMKELGEPVDKEEWGMPAHMVNAYYHPLLNEIAFPAGIMQPPFFDNNAEDAVNYGSIGMVIGHEFTHGFDDMGSKFAADGSFTNWWGESDREKFEARTKILGETFSNFCPIEGQCVNPDLTMGENIADLGGLTMAFHAYQMTDEYKSGEKKAGFTPAQRFFIAYAQLWKTNYTDEELKKRLATDSHSPGMYRVNGPLKNCPEFFEAFDVKEEDAMRNVAENVARIW